jgi:hypothetical protein
MLDRSKARLLLGVMLVAACGHDGITDPEVDLDVRPYVTGAAAANLDGSGHFVFAEPVSPTPLPILSSQRARDLAAADVRTWAPLLKSDWEKRRGAPINLGGLTADSRVYYVPTPFGPVPERFHLSYRRYLGPYYLVRMVDGPTPVMLVGVSAYATDVEINAQGQTVLQPLGQGGEFIEHVLPVDTGFFRVFTPEEAVVYLARLSSRKVTKVPELVRLAMPYSPTVSLWKLTLDQPVRVRASASSRVLDVIELYVGPQNSYRLQIPRPEQPTEEVESNALLRNPDGTPVESTETLRVPITAPTLFEPVTLEAPS